MIVTLTAKQMLQTWRSCAGPDPLLADCSVERFDGIDLDSRLSEMMRQWYLALLDEGNPDLIGTPALASALVSLSVDDGAYSATVVCQPAVRRLCSLRLSGWKRQARVVDRARLSGLLPLQSNRFSRAGVFDPIAWREPDGSIYAIPATADSRVVSATAVIDPGEDSYRLDTRALSTINDYLSSHFL